MKQRRHTPEQVVRKLAEGEILPSEGQDLPSVRQLEVTESTWHRWRNQYGEMKADDAKKLKELEKENKRLKKIVADQALDIDMLKELAEDWKLLTLGPPSASCHQAHGPAPRVSQRATCRLVGQHRFTQCLDPPVPDDEELHDGVERLLSASPTHPGSAI